MYYDNEKVILLSNIKEFSKEDFELSSRDWQRVLMRIGKEAFITAMACEIDKKDFESNYYDIEFPDGFYIRAISGRHLRMK